MGRVEPAAIHIPYRFSIIIIQWRWNTLGRHFQDVRVNDDLRFLLTRQSFSISFLGLSPQIGAAVHAGNVKNGDSFQRHAAEIERSAAALKARENVIVCDLKVICTLCITGVDLSPQSLSFHSVFCRKQRWFLKWQTQNTTACSSFCHQKKSVFQFVFIKRVFIFHPRESFGKTSLDCLDLLTHSSTSQQEDKQIRRRLLQTTPQQSRFIKTQLCAAQRPRRSYLLPQWQESNQQKKYLIAMSNMNFKVFLFTSNVLRKSG